MSPAPRPSVARVPPRCASRDEGVLAELARQLAEQDEALAAERRRGAAIGGAEALADQLGDARASASAPAAASVTGACGGAAQVGRMKQLLAGLEDDMAEAEDKLADAEEGLRTAQGERSYYEQALRGLEQVRPRRGRRARPRA